MNNTSDAACAGGDGRPSLVWGPTNEALWECTLGELIDYQAERIPDELALVISWQKKRMTFKDLGDRSKIFAKGLLDAGMQHGDTLGIMAGNCYEYIELILGSARVGCPTVVLNNTYTPQELARGVKQANCRMLFIATKIGPRDMSEHVKIMCNGGDKEFACPDLRKVITIAGSGPSGNGPEVLTYHNFMSTGVSSSINDFVMQRAEQSVHKHDVINLQFTSGTTGAPKAAMLTHRNLVNNGKLVADKMELTDNDVVCCPPPLFHCFGLVMGFLGTFTHGRPIVFPCDQYDADQVVDAIVEEKCTALLGVPTMFIAELQVKKSKKYKFTVRTGMAAGAPVPSALMKQLDQEMGCKGMLIAYGMTETSPVTFMTKLDDSLERRLTTVGTVMPHSGAKIVDPDGNIVARGVDGEICTCGYALQNGYWNNKEKTDEVMKEDENGIMWMHTGDQGVIDEHGYLMITGRIKDMIIRGGENIYPVEIEERLLAHEAVGEAAVIALPDERYGETVGCVLRQVEDKPRPSAEELQNWVRKSLGRQKAPRDVFWVGDKDIGEDYPKTGSGKVQKHILRDITQKIIKGRAAKAKL